MTSRDSQSAVRNPHRTTALSLVTAFAIVFLNAQLWLLMQAVEGALRGESTIVFPATLVSGLCFLGAWRLWRMLQ